MEQKTLNEHGHRRFETTPKKEYMEKENKSEPGYRFEFLLNMFTLACNRSQIREEEAKLSKKWEVNNFLSFKDSKAHIIS